MPRLWAAVRRWVVTGWPVATAVAVVGGGLWAAVPSASPELDLTTAAVRGTTLETVRPSDTGEVDPLLGAAVDAILARRGIAVKTNNLALFLRDVAPELRAEQTQLFRNLRTIGMTVTYRRAEPWINYEAVRRYGLATGTFRVSMRYQLYATKLDQTATDVGYTYTVRQGRLYLVDDNDLDQAIGAGRQPWDFGPVQLVRRKNVLVIVNQGQLPLAERLADQTVQMAKKVRTLWRGQMQQVPVVVAMREKQVLTELPPRNPGAEPARVQAMTSPGADGEPVGGWVVIPPSRLQTFDSAQMTHVLIHLLQVRLGGAAPRWLAEGLAEYAGNLQLVASGRGVEVAKRRTEVRKHALGDLTRLPSDDEFTATDSDDISWLAVEHLVQQIGLKPVTDFYRQVARRGYNDAAKERLLQEYTGFTQKKLVDSLRSLAG
jgi:hypothetical protein